MRSKKSSLIRAASQSGGQFGGGSQQYSPYSISANNQLVPNSYSPLVEQIQNWSGIYGNGLPYGPEVFRDGAFAPMDPIRPNYIDEPAVIDGEPRRPIPRVWQYPVGWNLPIGDPGTEGIKLANFQMLRVIADQSSITRACIERRIQDVINLEWDIVPTKEAHVDMVNNLSSRRDFEKRRKQVKEFFRYLDPQQDRSWRSWIRRLLEDLFVLDAVAIYVMPTKVSGKGIFGRSIAGLRLIDGSTIRPLVDIHGANAQAPATAYQQYLWGVPRTDLMQMVDLGPEATMQDLENINPDLLQLMETTNEYSGDQMIYFKQNPRNWTPYGFGPTEQTILPAYLGLARQTWQMEFFNSTTLPKVFIVPGSETVNNAQQVKQLQAAFNQFAGDLTKGFQQMVLPPGSNVLPMKSPDLTDQFDEWLTALNAMGFGLSITDLGITPRVGSLTGSAGSGAAVKNSKQIVNRRATLPTIQALKQDVFDLIIQKQLGQVDMEFKWSIEQREIEQDEIESWMEQVGKGGMTLDEFRLKKGDQPYNLPGTNHPVYFTAKGIVPFSSNLSAPPTNPLKPIENPQKSPQNAPKTDNTNDNQKLLTEIEILNRYVRKGRPINEFKPRYLPKAYISLAFLDRDNINTSLTKALKIKEVRDTTIKPLGEQLNTKLAKQLALLKENLTTFQAFEVEMSLAVKKVVKKVAGLGSDHASDEFNLDKIDTDSIVDKFHKQILGFVLLFATAVIAKKVTDKELKSRANNYGASLTRVYESAYGKTVVQNPSAKAIWQVEDEPCDLCSPRDGNVYGITQIPGWPGDGDFGEICEGGPFCKCHLIWKVGKKPHQSNNQARVQAIQQRNSGANLVPEDWAATGELHYPDATGQYPKVISKALEGMTHAGIAVVAKDTGRVYLQQRRFTHPKKAGIWEFPAGTLDPNENLFEGAKREWEEEVNLTLPKGELIDSWIVDHFIGFVWLIENQDAIPSTHRPHNPEVSGNVLWIDPSEALSLENLREELKSFDWDRLKINSKQTVDVQ